MGTHFPENSQERPLNTGEQTRPRSNGRSNRRSEESSQQTQGTELNNVSHVTGIAIIYYKLLTHFFKYDFRLNV